jgi:hypothetical protein
MRHTDQSSNLPHLPRCAASRLGRVAIWFSLMGSIAACAGKSGNESFTAGVLSEAPNADGLIAQQIDLNADGQMDVTNYFRERDDAPRLLVMKEMDLNWDGRIDVRTWFEPDGAIEREEMDGDFDGIVDWVDHYQGGTRVTSDIDTDNDGKFDLFKTYEQGRVRSKERDTNGDDKIDYWEYLDSEGNVTKTGRDVDGDGVMDIRED